MYRNSRFAELLNGLPRAEFDRLVAEHQSDKYCKGYDSWSHLVSMVYAQLSGVRSLRELHTGFNAQAHHHYHLRVRELKRSTISDANSQRDYRVFAELCQSMLSGAHRKVRQQVSKQLYLLDSTPIPLKGLGYEWTQGRGNSRVEGLHVHMVIAPDVQLPTQVRITDPNETDITVAKKLIQAEQGATYVFDRGYCDYNWWYELHTQGALFVTRLKKNAGVRVVKQRKIEARDRGLVLEDAVVEFKHEQTSGARTKNRYFGKTLRRITITRPDKGTPLVLITNDRKRHARQLGEMYKQRWEIELFFKWMKQNLKIKQFLGRSENAVKIQIYCAIIAYLLASEYRKQQQMRTSLKMVLTLFRTDMFSRPESDKSAYQKRKEERDKIKRVQRELSF